jgi:hypothetical protein
MGSALADKKFVWTKEMKATFNKAVAYLEKKKPITS